MGGKVQVRSTIAGAAALFAAAAAAALVFNWISPVGIPIVGQWDTAVGVVSAGGSEALGSSDREIRTVRQARALFDNTAALFVDARSPEAFSSGHIPGAVSMPVRSFDEWIPKFWEQVPMEKPIVTYCSGRTCEDSHRLAGLLKEVGYENVRVFIDGYNGWASAGHPTEDGARNGEEPSG